MFERRRVKHHIRALAGDHPLHARFVAHIGEDAGEREARKAAAHLQIDGIEVVFAVIQQPQVGRPGVRHLAHQLRADGAAGAGDQHALAGDHRRHGDAVEAFLRAAQQIGDGDGARLYVDIVGLHVGRRRHARKRVAGLFGPGQEIADLAAMHIGAHQHQFFRAPPAGVEFRQHAGEIFVAPQDIDALDHLADAIGAPRQHSHHMIALVPIALHRLDEMRGLGPGAHQQDRHARGRAADQPAQLAVLEHAVGEARPGQEHHQHQPARHQHRARQILEPVQGEAGGQIEQHDHAGGA